MDLIKFKNKVKKPLRRATICFLVKDNKILLAMKKRGFGKGRWNGVGGKVNIGETVLAAAIRETQEEIQVTPKKLKLVAKLDFYFPYVALKEDYNQQVIVYMIDDWDGKPAETEEMKPQWYSKKLLPYNKMWSDDHLWLPHVLAGKKVRADFYFNESQGVEDYFLKVY